MIVRRGMTGFSGNIYCGLHEFADMGLVLHMLRPGDQFIDVGANIGSYTVLASGVCRARTIAFEPDPDTAALLRRNIAANQLEDLVVVQESALGALNGEVEFTIGRDTTNQVLTTGEAPTRRVAIKQLDDIPGAHDAILMKIDVEGFEEQVLAGACDVLAHDALLAIESEGQEAAIVDTLNRFGFERAFYDPTSRTLSREALSLAPANGLFVRDFAAVRARVAAAPKRKVAGRWI